MKVLVVDDSTDIRNLIRTILTGEGHEVETAENAFEALDKYFKIKPDLVTLDISMPVMDGINALSNILSIDKNANVVMVSAMEQEDLIMSCLEKGAIGYIPKPFTKAQLVSSIQNVWRAGSHKFVTQLFILVAKKLQDVIGKIIDGAELSLKDIEVIEKDRAIQISPSADLSRIRAVSALQQVLKISTPQKMCGYLTTMSGTKNIVLSFVNPSDFDRESFDKGLLEMLQIMNSKVISELSSIRHSPYMVEQTRVYDETKDQIADADSVVKARMEITVDDKIIPFEIQLWFGVK
mgnify:CR=1 FL=1